MQEYPGGFVLDGCGCWSIFTCHTFREMLAEAQRRGQLHFRGDKVIRFEGDFLPVVENHGVQMALAIPGECWEFIAY